MNKIIVAEIKDCLGFVYCQYCCYSYRQTLIRSCTYILDFSNREKMELYYFCFLFVVFVISPNNGKKPNPIKFLIFAGYSDFVKQK